MQPPLAIVVVGASGKGWGSLDDFFCWVCNVVWSVKVRLTICLSYLWWSIAKKKVTRADGRDGG